MSSISNIFTAPVLTPPSVISAKTWHAHAVDRIAQSTEIADVSLKSCPALTSLASATLSEYFLLDVIKSIRNTSDRVMLSTVNRLGDVRAKIETLTTEHVIQLQDAAKRANSSHYWGVLKQIATTLLSALSIVLGLSFLSAGGNAIIGGALIFSGITSIANYAMTELGVWDEVANHLAHENEDRKKKLAILLPASVGILSGLVGAGAALASTTLGLTQLTGKALLIAESALALFTGVTTIGKGVSDARLKWTQADLSFLEIQLSMERFQLGHLMKHMEGLVYGTLKSAKSTSSNILNLIIQANLKLVQQSSA